MHILRHLDRAGRERLAAAFAAPGRRRADESTGLSRRALLQGAGGLVVVVGWGAHDAARPRAGRPRRRGRGDRAARAERLRPRRHRRRRHRRLQAPRDGPGQHDRPGVDGRRRARRRLGDGAHRVRAVGPEALRQPDVRRPAGHRRVVARSPIRSCSTATPARRRGRCSSPPRPTRGRCRRARFARRRACSRTPRASARPTARWPRRRAASSSAGDPVLKTPAQFVYIGKDKASPRVDSASKCDGSARLHDRRQAAGPAHRGDRLAAELRRQARLVRRERGEAGEGRHRRRAGARRRRRRRHRHLGGAARAARAQGAVGRVDEQAASTATSCSPATRRRRRSRARPSPSRARAATPAAQRRRRSRRSTSSRSSPTRRWSR